VRWPANATSPVGREETPPASYQAPTQARKAQGLLAIRPRPLPESPLPALCSNQPGGRFDTPSGRPPPASRSAKVATAPSPALGHDNRPYSPLSTFVGFSGVRARCCTKQPGSWVEDLAPVMNSTRNCASVKSPRPQQGDRKSQMRSVRRLWMRSTSIKGDITSVVENSL